jgi:hypothetical protein
MQKSNEEVAGGMYRHFQLKWLCQTDKTGIRRPQISVIFDHESLLPPLQVGVLPYGSVGNVPISCGEE